MPVPTDIVGVGNKLITAPFMLSISCVQLPYHRHNTKNTTADESGDGSNLRLLLIQFQFRHQTSDALLELTVLGGVDQRIDTAVAERQDHSEVVVPASKVESVAVKVETVQDFDW